MITLDSALLRECGLNDLSDAGERELLAKLYADLELRVGVELSTGLSDAQLDEFSRIIDAERATVEAWLARHAPRHADDPRYRELVEKAGEAAARAEFASEEWLSLYRPNHHDTVIRVFEAVKSELTQDPIGTVTRLQHMHSRAV